MKNESALANDPLASSRTSHLTSALRSYARAHLPEAMVPSHFVVLRELPKLPNGKVDRARLPAAVPEQNADDAYVAPRTATESRLARIWEDVLGRGRIGVETSFFDLGGDSLSVLRMAGRVGEDYQVRLDLRRLLDDPTIAQLARMLGSNADQRITARGDNERSVSAAELERDAVLPDDVRPEPGTEARVGPPYDTVLLTGGTGYTGAYLLRALLDRSQAQVHVLVRAPDQLSATSRVRRTLHEFDLWRAGDERRIVAVPGDIGRPYLGLTREIYRDLSARVELVVHNAAESSWTAPYARLKPVNILGTLEVLRLACRSRLKPVHYVCSIAIYPARLGEQRLLEVELASPDQAIGGYRQTKWVADKLMNRARARGLPTYVYRMGAITGAHDSGACSTDTFINDMIKGCIQLGAAMDYDLALELVPVDHCANVVSHIALNGTAAPAIFNVPAARTMSMNEVVEILIACGYPMRRLPYGEWRRELLAAVDRGDANELTSYLPLFGENQPAEEIGCPGARPTFDTTNLGAALDDSGITCPEVDAATFDRYLKFFVSVGFLPQPAQPERRATGG